MKNFYDWVCRVEVAASMITLVVSTLLIFISALARYLGWPINWSLEISLFLFAWCVFLSADVGLREDRLVNLDIITSRLPPKGRILMAILSYGIIFVFLLALIYFGFSLSYKTRARSFQGIPNFSYTWITISMPIAAMLMLVTVSLKLRGLYRRLIGIGKGETPEPATGTNPVPPV